MAEKILSEGLNKLNTATIDMFKPRKRRYFEPKPLKGQEPPDRPKNNFSSLEDESSHIEVPAPFRLPRYYIIEAEIASISRKAYIKFPF